MAERGSERALSKYRDTIERGALSETSAGRAAIRSFLKPLSDKIAWWMVERESKSGPKPALFRLCGTMAPDTLAYLTLRVSIDCATLQYSLLKSARMIGTAIEDELRVSAMETENPALVRAIKKTLQKRNSRDPEHARNLWAANASNRGMDIPRWSRNETIQTGAALLDLAVDAFDLLSIETIHKGRNRTATILRLTQNAQNWIADRTNKEALLRPLWLPTLEPPKDWKSPSGGGYHSDALRPLSLIKKPFALAHAAPEMAKLSTVYKALNAVQRTPWKINKPVLQTLIDVWEKSLPIACIPSREAREKPPYPEGCDPHGPEKRAWAYAAKEVHETNAKEASLRLELVRLISFASELADQPAIYFPHQLDFRGRMYAVPGTLQPQASDLARGLLTFAGGEPLTASGWRWLYIHGANVFGNDKVSFDDREAWGRENWSRALATAKDPLSDLWWSEVDKPWQFLAWCFEADRVENGDGLSSLPIALDGSCNGLQHFSALLRDPVGGAAVNLVPADIPRDIYQAVADRVMERLKAKALEDGDWTARAWYDFGIDRKITKRPVMVLPYGGTRRSCLEYVREAVTKKVNEGAINPFGTDEYFKATSYLATEVWHGIGDVVIAARAAMGWLQEMARILARNSLPAEWVSPSGFPVVQAYPEVSLRRIKTHMRGGLIRPRDYEMTDKLDSQRQALAISPNFVHSLDAAALARTVSLAVDGGTVKHFAVIHDSYGTTASQTDALAETLREAFVTMYQDHDPLEEFRAFCRSRLPEGTELPPLPPKGTLDIQAVLSSSYFFA